MIIIIINIIINAHFRFPHHKFFKMKSNKNLDDNDKDFDDDDGSDDKNISFFFGKRAKRTKGR